MNNQVSYYVKKDLFEGSSAPERLKNLKNNIKDMTNEIEVMNELIVQYRQF